MSAPHMLRSAQRPPDAQLRDDYFIAPRIKTRLALLFTGHMTDAPNRASPRFPAQMEAIAVRALRIQIRSALTTNPGSLIGIASGARGGDILFHEICLSEGIPTHIVLPFGTEAFLAQSVRSTDGSQPDCWETRFWRIWHRLGATHRTILDTGDKSDPFGACNDAMLAMAQSQGQTIELLALWDGEGAAKLGGTAAFVEHFRTATGGHFTHIDSKALLFAMEKGR
jgi:hypothetical protein